MNATLVTDGSFCIETRAASWAAMARSSRGSILEGGVFVGGHSSINPVEMRAMLFGLRAALARKIILPGDHVTLQTDSTHAAGRMAPGYQSKHARRRARRGLPPPAQIFDNGSPRIIFLELIVTNELTYDVVCSGAGHALGEVDYLARRMMIEERARRQGATPAGAEIAGFEDALVRARNDWIKQQPPSSEASLAALDEMAREIETCLSGCHTQTLRPTRCR